MRTIYAMPEASVKKFLAVSRDIRASARGMTAEEMRSASEEIKKMARINSVATLKANNAPLYLVDEYGAAHIPIEGMLVSQASPCAAWFGETVTEYGYIIEAVKTADLDPSVQHIVLDIDSGGGYVEGVDAVAQAIASVEKRTTSCVHNMAASAAYWLASQADSIQALSPAVQVGSIGVACEMYDDDAQLAADGVVHRVFSSTDAPNKRPNLATEEGQSVLIKELDDLHAVFVSRVAEGRNVSTKKVNEEFGRGGVLIAADALKAGMIDDIRGISISRKNRPGVAGEQASASSAAKISGGHQVTTLDEFKAANPGVLEAHDEAIRTAALAEGAKNEAARRDGISAYLGKTKEGDKAVAEAIASGKSVVDAMPALVAATIPSTLNAAADNAPSIGARTPDNGSGTNADTEDDIAAAKVVGMSIEDYRKYKDRG